MKMLRGLLKTTQLDRGRRRAGGGVPDAQSQ